MAAISVAAVSAVFLLVPRDGDSTSNGNNNNGNGSNGNNTNGTNGNSTNWVAPPMQLLVLKGPEDHSPVIATYRSTDDGGQQIDLVHNSHIRFEPRDYRLPDSMYVIVKNVDTGKTEILRKSYNVDNEFFVFLREGQYQLDVQTGWSGLGNTIYHFSIKVVAL